jgi:hypothetical protein
VTSKRHRSGAEQRVPVDRLGEEIDVVLKAELVDPRADLLTQGNVEHSQMRQDDQQRDPQRERRKQQDQRQALDVFCIIAPPSRPEAHGLLRRPAESVTVILRLEVLRPAGQHHIGLDQFAGPVAHQNPAVGAVEQDAVDLALNQVVLACPALRRRCDSGFLVA